MFQSFETLIQQGVQAGQANNTELALQRFKEAGEAAPGNGLPFFLAAGELAQAGRMEEAESAYATALLMAPDMSLCRYQLGLLQFATGRLPLALSTWQPLLGLPEDDFIKVFVEGYFALAAEDTDTAEARFRAGMALNTVNPPMNHDVERVLGFLATAKAAQAQSAAAASPAAGSADPSAERGDEPNEAHETDDTAAHVLLSNYQPAGRPN